MVASLAGAVISHSDAAALHALDGFTERADGRLHVCFARDHKRELDCIVHTWRYTDARDIATVDGIRCTSIARTLFQLGAVCSSVQVAVALDSALAAGASPRWIEETWKRLRRPGHTGANTLEAVMYDPARAGGVPESLFERLLERVLQIPGVSAPQRQYEIRLETGVHRVDLAFPDARLAVEAHSRRFHFGPAREEADNLRDIGLAAAGWEVLTSPGQWRTSLTTSSRYLSARIERACSCFRRAHQRTANPTAPPLGSPKRPKRHFHDPNASGSTIGVTKTPKTPLS